MNGTEKTGKDAFAAKPTVRRAKVGKDGKVRLGVSGYADGARVYGDIEIEYDPATGELSCKEDTSSERELTTAETMDLWSDPRLDLDRRIDEALDIATL